ncbi:MAG: PAS domain S-box protein [Verrucomicrobia bacterium]|nr:PAS domain S-box protein [Verrucomicrobiota bacterium]
MPSGRDGDEASLRQSEERLRYALNASSDGLWDWDLATHHVYFSPRWKSMLGYADQELENHFSTWDRLVDPSERDRVVREAEDYTADRIPKFEVEFRMRHKAGHWVEILSRATAMRDAQGQAVRLIGTHTDITDRKRADDEIWRLTHVLEQRVQERSTALIEMEDRMRRLVALVPAGIVIYGADGRILLSNPAAQKMLGLSSAEAAGKGVEDPAWQFLRADGTPMALEGYPVSQVLARRAALLGQIVGIRRRPGQVPLWTLVNAEPRFTPDGRIAEVIVGFMDISERIQAENLLRQMNDELEKRVARRTADLSESEARLRTLSEATFEGIMLSRNGIIEDCNDQLARMFGYSRGDLLGRAVLNFVVPEARERLGQAISEGVEAILEQKVICKDGSHRLVESHGRSPGGPNALRFTAIRDVTERRKTEEQLEASRAALERSRRLAEISEISAGIVHQIGQPVSAIAGNVFAARELMAQGHSSRATMDEMLGEIEADLQRIRDIMARLRSLVHPLQNHRQRTDLNQLVAEALDNLNAEAEAQEIQVQFDRAATLPLVTVDRVQINQALRNLVENAFQAVATSPVKPRLVRITTRAVQGGGVELEVGDSGPGITPGQEERIFDSFYTSKPKGMGIGLRIARTIIQTHGGQLEACNNHHSPGATFRLRLPVCTPPAP